MKKKQKQPLDFFHRRVSPRRQKRIVVDVELKKRFPPTSPLHSVNKHLFTKKQRRRLFGAIKKNLPREPQLIIPPLLQL